MAVREATGSGFRARAAALTLLVVAGSMDRDALFELLEDACSTGIPSSLEGLPGWTELDAFEHEIEQMLEEVPPVLAESPAFIRAHVNARRGFRADDKELGFVAIALQRWLRKSPAGTIGFGPQALDLILPLVCSWSGTVAHALAAGPHSLAELDRAVDLLSRSNLEGHVAAMVQAGQVETLQTDGETRYELTDWAREAIAPIVAAVRYERRFPEDDTLPPDVLDVEAAFQMALPLLRLPSDDLRGTCRLGVQVAAANPAAGAAGGSEPLMAGATVEVASGHISSSTLLEREPETWVTGTPLDWCETVIDPAAAKLKAGGDTALTGTLIEALHETLFGEHGI